MTTPIEPADNDIPDEEENDDVGYIVVSDDESHPDEEMSVPIENPWKSYQARPAAGTGPLGLILGFIRRLVGYGGTRSP